MIPSIPIRVATAVVLVIALSITASAQMTHRLKGFLRTEPGAPIASASIRADALSGFRGEPFAGQKDFTVQTTATAEWNLLGIHAGLWMFSTKAPGMLPAATRIAAGELALLVQQASLAKSIFGLVLQSEPKHPRALLGSASASLLGRDWETAGKVLWEARDVAPKDQRQALAAAIDDLRGISRVH